MYFWVGESTEISPRVEFAGITRYFPRHGVALQNVPLERGIPARSAILLGF